MSKTDEIVEPKERIKTLEAEVARYKKFFQKAYDELENFEKKHGDYSDLINNYLSIRYPYAIASKLYIPHNEQVVFESEWYKEWSKAEKLLTKHRELLAMYTKCSLVEQGRI